MASQDEGGAKAGPQPEKNSPTPQENTTLFQAFVKIIETLSGAERAVFDLYMEGHTVKEIADILCLSINTIKTHNRRIYMKLNVTSRKELMVYIQMMEEAKEKA
ncbi:MAG: helix-turn-helix transcriptional regulator [Oscillospiraceae bacterium]|nr:helix-turn-helix transcriptional regulator [Oscillospiraceae bacterium]